MSRLVLWPLVICFLQTSAFANQNPTNPLASHSSNTTNQSSTQANQPESSIAERNLVFGKTFLEENKKKQDIYTLSSGLQYKILQEGTGSSPKPTDFVTVNYRGTLLEGTEFGNSYTHHSPTTLAVNAVIPGWSEALQLMKPGSKWTIYVPPQLAYGERGDGRLIGPNATLIFDIELISIKPPLDENPEGSFGELSEEG